MTDRRELEASLAEIDRKVRELQRELALVASPEPESQPPAAPAPDNAGRALDEAAARVAELGRRVDDLIRLRKELEGATRALVDEYRGIGSGHPSR